MNWLFALALIAPQDLSSDEQYERLQLAERVTNEVRVVQAVTPAVVYIETEGTRQVRNFFGAWNQTYGGSGSGVVVHADGYVVTNYHVVKGAQKIDLFFEKDPTTYPARLISFVESEDLALLELEADGPFPTVRMGTSSDLMAGERVVAIGNPHGQTHTVSTGIISGLHRDVQIPDQGLFFDDLIQTDASINAGNSGGPLLNIRGELIGINTAMNRAAENIGFAIPVDRVREVLTDHLFPQARKAWLGFQLTPGDDLVVASVLPDSPAALAGICEGDRILSLGQRRLGSQDDYLLASLEVEPQEPVEIQFERAGRVEEARVRTWDRLDGMTYERLGLTVREEILGRDRWLFVDRVEEGGPASRLGLSEGDLIPAARVKRVRGARPLQINSRQALARLLTALEPGTELDLNIYRDDNGDRLFARNEMYEGTLALR